ncbi:GSCOCG00009931001-RA-CDS [Cotesia congregata]|uniref:Exocyst complex component 8 n=1 Tax=Cotesia congregata TaxID=51543 RepID=A0A8J2HIV9_COTCN|nr:GSCOCG00009931001-RA-CDS [Cotesia congregata]CAG5102718.1 Similar to exoc8: Exocyst complex component 8 (Xenopus laevis) [Cotesia congregata]
MTEELMTRFANDDFNPDKFVKDLSTQCIGATELHKQRIKIQELNDKTSIQLKRNVYQNYMQFIETAKEISHLESEMYQLSQLLSEQRSLLSALNSNRSTGAIFDDILKNHQDFNVVSKEQEQKQKLIQLLEHVEGGMSLVDTPGRICFHEGSLLELDPLEGTPLKRVHGYLFNDILMIASWLSTSGRRQPSKYKVQAVYNLQCLAVVNVKDLGSVKLAFKLLAFPDTRVFQCASAISKKEWLEKCEQAKKIRLLQECPLEPTNKQETQKEFTMLTSRSMSLDSHSLGVEEGDDSADSLEPLPEWLSEVTEDLDSCIAQRHFEEAYNLFEKAMSYLKATQTSQSIEIKKKIENRGKCLVEVLTDELELSIEAKSLQGGGLRSARRAVKLLIQLNRSAQACKIYLQLCNAALTSRLKRVKREGTVVPYVKQLSAIAFSNIFDMAKEFLKLFSPSMNCTSSLIVWCSQEVKYLTSHLIKQLFIPQVTLGTLVECIHTVRSHCDQLTYLGIDLRYQLDGQLRTHLARALQDSSEKYIDAIKVRAAEDNWRPLNFQTSENLQKLQSELDDLGIPIPSAFITSDCWISLTSNTLAFSKLYIGLLDDCLSIYTPELLCTIETVLISVLRAQVQYILVALNNPKLKSEKKLVQDNTAYIREIIIQRGLELYRSIVGQEFTELIELKKAIIMDLTSEKSKLTPKTLKL